jgi:hypothetical protein
MVHNRFHSRKYFVCWKNQIAISCWFPSPISSFKKFPMRGYAHGPGYPAYAHKLRTDQWQPFGGTSIHHSLPLDETASNYSVSRSPKEQFS